MSEGVTTTATMAGAGPPRPRLKRPVFVGSAVGVVLVALWAMVVPDAAAGTIGSLVGWISGWFGWFYILLATVVLVFVVFLALSRYGHVKLGPQNSTPQFSTFAWASMLFAAGIGTDLMFFAVAEPVTQYLAPPTGEGSTVEAAGEATAWTLFHYGINGWGMYALMGIALAYFSYRMNMPLAVRSVLYPIFGKRIHGPVGDAVDLAAVLGTIFGVATSLGIGVVQLNYGLYLLLGVPEGQGTQIALVAIAVAVAIVSAVSGVDKGIKRLSQLNVLLALGLAGFILLTGRTAFLLNGLVLNVGDFVSTFPGRTLQTFAFDPPVDWLADWTLFFWAWWIAWASFVGLFLARISRGRTIRQFVLGTLVIPFSYILMWISIFGNSAIDAVRSGDAAFGELAMNTPERGFYTLLMDYPAFTFVAGLATVIGLLFYVTSADSGALVMANLSSRLPTPEDDAGAGVRIFWGVVTGLLTIAMLFVGGVPTLQSATIVMGLPFAFVMVLVMAGLYKALRAEMLRGTVPGDQPIRGPGAADRHGSESWRRRVEPAAAYPDEQAAEAYLDEICFPALEQVAAGLRDDGVTASAHRHDDGGRPAVELRAEVQDGEDFRYRVEPNQAPVPAYLRPAEGLGDTYSRLDVDGSSHTGYDVMGYTHAQLVDDVIEQYQGALETGDQPPARA
ncbi:choline BCCT transporter BetT [Jannaschia sp. R86511]|uniref:choline BCCT transporter BetT n=1 Tax=Jannaschia sp. R86511 TaxID=3093853 RepID=UPI0036D37617